VGVLRAVTGDKHPAFHIGEEIVSHPERPTRSAFQFWWSETVRWGDMDALRHVNNVAYLQYLESARIGFFEDKGWNSVDIGAAGQGPVVVSQTFNYRRQLHYPAEVEIGVACTEVRQRSFVLSYGVFRKGTDELIGDGSTVLAWLDYAANKAVGIPSKVLAFLTLG